MDHDKLERIFSSERRFSFVAHQVSEGTAKKINTLLNSKQLAPILKGIRMEKVFKRYYPKREIAAQLLGWAGVDNQGVTGLELGLDQEFNAWIRGDQLRIKAFRAGGATANGHTRLALFDEVLPALQASPPRVETTIDLQIQAQTERLLEQGLQRTFARRAAAIILEVQTGEIITIAHVPRVDPNMWLRASPADRLPWTVVEVFEPGSVIKPLTVAAAIDAGVITPETIFDTHNGKLRIADKTIRDLRPMKQASVADILRHSSNIGTAKIARKLGQKELYAAFVRAGLGTPTGIPMPHEASGSLRRGKKGWDPVSFANISFGQGLSVTPLQMARIYAALGNGGKLMVSHLIRKIEGTDGQNLYEAQPQVMSQIVTPETADTVLRLLAGVVEPGATGHKAAISDCPVGGKTGTGQQYVRDPETGRKGYSGNAEVASFGGLLPILNPKYAIYVVVDRPVGGMGGGTAAAPISKEISKMLIDTQGLRPCGLDTLTTTTFRNLVPQPRKHPRATETEVQGTAASPLPDSVIVPALLGKTVPEALQLISNQELRPAVQGAGIVISQQPKAGALVTKGTAVDISCNLNAGRVNANR